MKINIKGFTFVGFAAAIFAMNAMADDTKIVTSKSYVDAKIVTSVDGTAADKSPSQGAVKTALDGKQTKDTGSDYVVSKGGSWQAMTSAVIERDTGVGAHYVDITEGTNGEAVLGLDSSKLTTTYNSDTWNTAATAGNLVTQGVIVNALEANGGTVNTGVLTVTQNGVDKGSFNANDSTSPTIAIVAPNWDQLNSTSADYIANKPTITSDKDEIGNATDQDTKQLPTTYAVKQYLADSSVVGNGQLSITVNDTTQTFNANDSTNKTFTVTGLEVESNKAEAISTGDNGNYNDSTQYASTKAVYDYVQSQTGGTVIPKRSPTCDTYPCALVNGTNGAHWYTMAQSGHDGGLWGDWCDSAADCPTGSSCNSNACTTGA